MHDNEIYDPDLESLKFQLEILKSELKTIDQTVERTDQITQATKNWAVVTWAGTISIIIGQPDLRIYVAISAILPFFFWLIDGYWRSRQRKFLFRGIKIKEFLNDDRLLKSFKQKKLVEFVVYDPDGYEYKELPLYQRYVSIKSTLTFLEVRNFYLGLIIISIVLNIAFCFI